MYMWLLSGVVNMWSVAFPTVYFLNTFQPHAADVKGFLWTFVKDQITEGNTETTTQKEKIWGPSQ